MRTLKHLWPLILLLLVTDCEGKKKKPKQSKAQKKVEPGSDDLKVPNILERSQLGRISPGDFRMWHESYLQTEESETVGSDLTLTHEELSANQIIMAAKTEEYEEGLSSPRLFAPSKHLFEVLDQIKRSRLFKMISKMPKGGVLHAHDTALCSTDFVLELTYRDNLWVCYTDRNGFEVKTLRFSEESPDEESGCEWDLLSDVRESIGDSVVDNHFRERLTLYPKTKYEDNNEVWTDFINIFGLLDGLLFYAPVWADYYYNALKEFSEDGVQYLEFRTTLPILYDLEGTKYTALDTVRIYYETLDKFKKETPDFIGSKLIYAPLRHADDSKMKEYITTMNTIRDKYPDFVIGFDLVGQEEKGRPLKEFATDLLSMRQDINFYFHAGETNWLGSSVDENLIDAILLGTKRIGHAFAIVKHPLVMRLIKEYSIAVELNPISNQVLQLVGDLRNHPGAVLFAGNYPVVVSSDDPSFWKTTPLSHDFYVAFLGIASAHADLRLLKKLALNSISYSGMNPQEQHAATAKWEKKWNEFIKAIIGGRVNRAATSRLQTNKVN